MRYKKATRYAILVIFTFLAPALLAGFIPRAHAVTTYGIGTIPFLSQEGSTFTVVFQVNGAIGGTNYQFRFVVKDPAGNLHTSVIHSYNTSSGQTQFTLPLFFYPTPGFPGPNNLVGQYFLNATQVQPVITNPNVATTSFWILLTDQFEYERTQTVSIKATGYAIGEPATVKITTVSGTPPTTVFAVNTTADLNHQVTASWHIPRNAVLDPNGYVVTVTGTTTVKNPADLSIFNIKAAVMSISSLNSVKSSYQRTETMSFSFQPTYPDGSIASTGVGLITLARPGGGNVTLTTAYSSPSQTFNATYKTSATNVTGTWTGSLAVNGYADAWGNSGPSAKVASTPQLVAATFTIVVSATTYVPIGQQVKFNATIGYPDGTILGSGNVKWYLIYTGTPSVTHSGQPTFDTGHQFWVGSYAPQTSDPGGLWSLIVNATDSPIPPNSGTSSAAITLQDRAPVASFTPSQSTAPTGTSITFDGTASYDPDGTITSYSWTFGDGYTGTGAVVSHSFSPAQVYTVTLTVIDNGGKTNSTLVQVTVTDRPPTVSYTSSPSSPTTGQTVTLTISSFDPDGSVVQTLVAWGDGTSDLLSGAATSDTHSYGSTGSSTSQSFTVAVTVTDNSGSIRSSSASITITDRPPAVAFTPSSTAIVTGQNVTLTISAADPDGTVSSKQVNWGDGTIDVLSASAMSDSHNYASTGTAISKVITITVSANDNSGSTGSSSSSITLSDRPPVVSITLSSASASTGQTVTVTIASSDPDGTIASTKVDWGDGVVDTLTGGPSRDTHVYTSTGSASSKTYAVAVSVTDNSGSTTPSQTATINVTGNSSSSGSLTLPLYYFGILAAAIAALLVGGFLAFRRHRVTHARLKIDLEAVKSEAGRIENNEFFQSVKDQLKKDNEGQ